MNIQNMVVALGLSFLLSTAISKVDDQPRKRPLDIASRRNLVDVPPPKNRQFFRGRRASFQNDDEVARIYGGAEVKSGRYPYIAALLATISPGEFQQVCAGSLISATAILTAAHCMEYADTIWLGAENLTMGPWELNFERYNVSALVVSPKYDPIQEDSDFALILLDRPSSFTPVTYNTNIMKPQTNSEVVVVGWGKTASSNMSMVPREASLTTLSNAECESMYTPYANVTPTMICATGGYQRDACQGDSGGPLIIKGRDASTDIVIGVVSWGFDCADARFPGVYSRVASAADWLKYELK
mmetsp:Transcript_12363/g.17783  ORF Transcript_12363/g.17783 Transcript_12363/m.17783 type:complete len:300 (+) Transcript_12363:194-1093(+)